MSHRVWTKKPGVLIDTANCFSCSNSLIKAKRNHWGTLAWLRTCTHKYPHSPMRGDDSWKRWRWVVSFERPYLRNGLSYRAGVSLIRLEIQSFFQKAAENLKKIEIACSLSIVFTKTGVSIKKGRKKLFLGLETPSPGSPIFFKNPWNHAKSILESNETIPVVVSLTVS